MVTATTATTGIVIVPITSTSFWKPSSSPTGLQLITPSPFSRFYVFLCEGPDYFCPSSCQGPSQRPFSPHALLPMLLLAEDTWAWSISYNMAPVWCVLPNLCFLSCSPRPIEGEDLWRSLTLSTLAVWPPELMGKTLIPKASMPKFLLPTCWILRERELSIFLSTLGHR